MSKSREQLNDWLRAIDITDKLCLDVGVQDKPTSRLTTGKPRRYFTNDIDPKWSPDIVADLNDPSFVTKMPDQVFAEFEKNQGFDVIFCIETLEHCWNPIQVLENFKLLLNDKGRVYISTPFLGPHHDVVDYYRFVSDFYRDVLPKVGLELLELHERVATTGRKALIDFYSNEYMRVSKVRPEYGHYSFPIGYFVIAGKMS